MIDMRLDKIVIRCAPLVSDSCDVASRVVVQVINLASVVVIVNLVIAPILFGSHVDVMEINRGDTPEVAGNHVVT